ncbi:hypothetical protein [Streptomyces subrutilus]|uniref:hypothetical protein n=1 Tax=Streptomyces subrutilus TaxID=36818 RepID=UPI00099FD438|nr:hypothetical protein [Streptomyces subrutilus]
MPPSTARSYRRVPRAAAVAVAALCAVPAAGGCAGSPAASHGAHARESREPSASIEEIAAAVGCTAHVDVQADELREGGCQTGEGAYRMVTFAADEGQRSWLAEARMYGGTYLVGGRWVVTAPSEQALTALRGRIGGDLEAGDSHGGGHH